MVICFSWIEYRVYSNRFIYSYYEKKGLLSILKINKYNLNEK